MTGLVNFGHSPLLESMLTFSTWQGGFSAADKQAMKDALKTIRTAMVQPAGTTSGAKRRNAKCIFAPEYEGLYSCPKCGEETAVLACVNEGGDMERMKPRFCGFCGAKVVEVVEE